MNEFTTQFVMTMTPKGVWSDTRHNKWWIIGIFVAVILYIAVSAAVVLIYQPTWSYAHSLYFTTINVTTVGFGDVTPTKGGSKFISGVNAFVGLIFFGILVAVLALALQPGEVSGKATITNTFPPGVAASQQRDEQAMMPAVRDGQSMGAAVARLLGAVEEAVKARKGEGAQCELRSRDVIVAIRTDDDHAHVRIEILLHASKP